MNISAQTRQIETFIPRLRSLSNALERSVRPRQASSGA